MSDVRLCYAFPPIARMLKRTKINPRPVGLRPKAKSTARVAAHPPTWIKPQLTRLVDKAPTGEEWLHEIKYDGYRMHGRIDGEWIVGCGSAFQRSGAAEEPLGHRPLQPSHVRQPAR